jgi:alanyl-tRNA synthetase
MAEAIFDGAGNLTNLEELTAEEVAAGYAEKNREVFNSYQDEKRKTELARTEAEKAKQDLELVKNKVNPKELEEVQSVKGIVEKLALSDAKRVYGYENSLSPEETDKVFQLTGNKPSKEILEDPFVKGGLEAIRNSRKLADNMPGTSTNSTTFAAGKNTEEMKPDEKQAEFEKYMSAKFRK